MTHLRMPQTRMCHFGNKKISKILIYVEGNDNTVRVAYYEPAYYEHSFIMN